MTEIENAKAQRCLVDVVKADSLIVDMEKEFLFA